MLIVARAFQALGGSGGIVLTRAIVRDIYSGRARRTRIVGDRLGDGARAGAGANSGGLMQTAFGWRSTFLALGRAPDLPALQSSGRFCLKH